ncbi:fimbrial protein [Salmonella enterica]|nr:fimbrial protein [Salmonella enterica]EGA0602503.1 fimbrial protein [Salmonella enterica]EHD2148101.1 fimbrial protein [Salmonella enterica]EHK2354323.1 fimbrial protein [Salmonella enterica]
MKKTVIAAALASTVFSGAAMAWTAAGTGGNIEMGGSIQITPYTTPWEVMVGAPATALNANITKGVKVVAIPVTKAIPVLGIRTVRASIFNGRPGIDPQINFNGAVKVDNFVNGTTTMNLPVVNADNPATQIGTLETKFSAAALSSYVVTGNSGVYSTFAASAGDAFWGGIAKQANKVAVTYDAAREMINSINPAYLTTFSFEGTPVKQDPQIMKFISTTQGLSGAYGSGIQSGANIKLTLTAPAANDVIKWKASMPVTISYQ